MNLISLCSNASRTSRRSPISRSLVRAGLTAACSLALSVSVSAFAEDESSFQDDFEDYGDWAALAEPWVTAASSGYIYAIIDSANLFDQGTSNRIVTYSKSTGSAQGMILQNAFSAEVGRVAFDFVRSADGSEDSLSIILSAGDRGETANRAFLVTIGNEAINGAEYERGTATHVEIVFNNGNYAIHYGDDRLLYPGTADIWVNGELGNAGFSSNNNRRGPVTSFEFNSASTTQHEFYFDNVAIEPVESEKVPSVVFFDDFESHTDSAPPEAPWQPSPSTGGGAITVEADSSNLFGQGADNRILDYSKTGDTGAQALILQNEFATEIGRMSFDMVRPADGSTDTLWVIMNVGPRVATHRAQVITIGNDAIHGASYERGAVNHVELVFNNSHETVLYADGNSLAAGTTDIWINSQLKATGITAQNNQRGAVSTFEFNSAGGRTHQFYFDNIVFEPIEWEEVPPQPPQIILHEDFSEHVIGTLSGAPWTAVGEVNGIVGVEQDTENIFGKGPSNHILNYKSVAGGIDFARITNGFSSEVITFSMRFYAPDDPEFAELAWLIFNAGTPSGTTNRVLVLDFGRDGNILSQTPYELDAVNEVDIAINNSTRDIEYGNGHLLASRSAHIWLNGVLAETDVTTGNVKQGAISSFEFNIQGGRQHHSFIDEIVIWDQVVIDEAAPSEGGFADWRATHFPNDADNAEISGPAANPSGDGISNLIKYALDLDPAIASREGLPVNEMQEIDGTTYLTLTFQRTADRDDVDLTVFATGDLSAWETEAVLVETIDNGEGSITEVWRDIEPIEEAGARFLRLEVSLD